MSGDLFDRLDLQLAESTRQGTHLLPADQVRRRRSRLVRRGVASGLLAIALAAALASEFPAVASGHAPSMRPTLTATL